MALSTDAPKTRRGLVAGTLGGLAVVVGTAIGRPTPASAETDPDAVHKNVNNSTTAATSVTCSGATSIRAISTGGGTTKSGVFAQANGTSSRGVTGVGVTGVLGQSNGSAGRGVTGLVGGANATGVFGDATSTSGTPEGTFGRSRAPDGVGARGENLATSGDAYGVFGDTASPDGAGVRGEHNPNTGIGAGVSGVASSPAGKGVEGFNSTTSGAGIGVFGQSRGPTGRGVRGLHQSGSGVGVGVEGETASAQGIGVFGHAEAATGGTGVIGSASHASAIGGSFQGTGGAVAMQVAGPVQFTTSGIATIPSGFGAVVVNPGVDINANSKVLCTLMSNPGGTTTLRHVTKNNAADTFQINLSANSTADCNVAWFVIS
jgi:hypothetical protein